MKNIVGIIIFLFLSSTLNCEGKNNYINFSHFSKSKETLKGKIEKKHSYVLFKKSSHQKSPIKPKKKKRNRGVEPVHYFMLDLREQFVFNSFGFSLSTFYFQSSKHCFNTFISHSKRGPPSYNS